METKANSKIGTIKRLIQSKKFKKNIFYFSVVSLPILQFIIFYIFVNFRSILLAFQDYSYDGGYTFIGFTNFIDFFQKFSIDPKMDYAIKNSFLLYFCNLFVGTGGAILFSNYIYKKCFGSQIFKITLFLPTIASGIVMVTAYKSIMNIGMPIIIEKITGERILPLLADVEHNFLYVLVFYLWFNFGTQVLMYTSTMSGISTEIVESANIEGITPVKELWYITIPMIYKTLVSFITIGLAGFFTNQMMVFSFYGIKADAQFYNLGYYLYRQSQYASTFSDYDIFTEVAAAGLVMSAIAAPLTIIVRKMLEKYGPSED